MANNNSGPYRVTGYGLSDALPNVFPSPIVAKRAPTSNDLKYQLGQIWILSTSQLAYILVQVVGGVATWLLLESGGGSGTFSSLTVTPGPTSLTGTTTVTGTVTSSGNITATAGGLTATAGNITASNGNVVLSTAATFVQLPGPVNISSGAGVPAGALALHVGDMYINTTAATAATRAYMATAVGTWTNFTMAA